MERLKGWNLFGEIKQYKAMGLNKSQVQRTLNVNYKTVDKYWNMSPAEYAQLSVKNIELWWPNGMGNAKLYNLKTEFIAGNEII